MDNLTALLNLLKPPPPDKGILNLSVETEEDGVLLYTLRYIRELAVDNNRAFTAAVVFSGNDPLYLIKQLTQYLQQTNTEIKALA